MKAYIQGKTDVSESENNTLSGRRQKVDSINITPSAPLSSSLFGEFGISEYKSCVLFL